MKNVPCECDRSRQGKTTCDGDVETCVCKECPPFELTDAPAIEACSGQPFGTWRLTHAEWGRLDLVVFAASATSQRAADSCEAMVTAAQDEVPLSLMSLFEGGKADYYSVEPRVKLAYEDGCVTRNATRYFCGSEEWAGLGTCKAECGVCNCESSFPSSEATGRQLTTWERTEETLVVAPLGQMMRFSYCAGETLLELSSPAAHLVFERVYPLGPPTPCAERSGDTCVSARGECRRGACTGGPSCAGAATEGACLTTTGCEWDADTCFGNAETSCRLEELGVVPGCDLTAGSAVCEGEPTACGERTLADCMGGCNVADTGRCAGGTLQCDQFDYCVDQCQDDCRGEVSCSAFDELNCDSTNDSYDGVACTWEQLFCDGEATPCVELSPSECTTIPGCRLTAAP